jgi:branched-chain amino acid transport system substrate-binding protein
MGVLWDLTGHSSVIGVPSKLVGDIWLKEINAAGGINGHPVKVVAYDTASDTTKAVTFVKRLIEKDKVHVIVGPTTTGKAMACIPVVQKAAIPMVASVGGSPVVVPVKKWVFKSPAAINMIVQKQYAYMLKHTNLRKIGLISASIGFGEYGRKDSIKYLSQYPGIEIVADERFKPTDTDMTAQLMKISRAGAQAVVCWTIGPTASIVAKNMKQIGMDIPLYLCHGNPLPVHLKVAGEAAEGNIFVSYKLVVWDTLPENDPAKAFLKDMIPRYTKIAGKDISLMGWAMYDCFRLSEQGIRNTRPDPKNLVESRKKIRDGIESVKNLVLMSGIFNMTPEDHQGTKLEDLCMATVKNGRYVYLAP